MIDFLTRLYHFDELIRWGGYVALVAIVFSETGLMAGFFLPGDSLLVTAGLFAAAGQLKISTLVFSLVAASIAGDSLNYWVGRHLGPRIFSREDSILFHRDHLHRTKRFYEKYGRKTVVLGRFMPIIRTFAPVVAGVGEMPYRIFLPYSIIGGISWVCSMLFTGYFLGRSIPHVDRHVHKIILIVIFISILPPLVEYWKDRRAQKALG